MKKILLSTLLVLPLICVATPPVASRTNVQDDDVPTVAPVHLGGVYPADTCESEFGCLTVHLNIDVYFPKVTFYWYRYLSGDVLVPYTGHQAFVQGKKLAPLHIPLTYEGNEVLDTKIWFTRGRLKPGTYCLLDNDENIRNVGMNRITELNLYAYKDECGIIRCELRRPLPEGYEESEESEEESEESEEAEEIECEIYDQD